MKLSPIQIKEALTQYACQNLGIVGTPEIEIVATCGVDVPQGCSIDFCDIEVQVKTTS